MMLKIIWAGSSSTRARL